MNKVINFLEEVKEWNDINLSKDIINIIKEHCIDNQYNLILEVIEHNTIYILHHFTYDESLKLSLWYDFCDIMINLYENMDYERYYKYYKDYIKNFQENKL